MAKSLHWFLAIFIVVSGVSCAFDAPAPADFLESVIDGSEVSSTGATDALMPDVQLPAVTDATTPVCEPDTETCNLLDDDCDGVIDEDFPTLGQNCVLNQGLCEVMGRLVCDPQAPSSTELACSTDMDASEPQTEACDGLDNDCDGETDEVLFQDCYDGLEGSAGLGECRVGTQACSNAEWGLCEEQILPVEEACNDLDDDCDGATDEALSRSCYTGPDETLGVGECRAGDQLCQTGSWEACRHDITPVAELCNERDDDCDGQIDETFTNLGDACSVGLGECKRNGEFVCANDEVRCSESAGGVPVAELCDGRDNDCDGQTDETFDLVNRCIVGIGECARSAVPECREDGQGTVCPVMPGSPVTEGVEAGGDPRTCDGYDNDCDGRVDEQNLDCCIDGAFDAACIASRLPGAP